MLLKKKSKNFKLFIKDEAIFLPVHKKISQLRRDMNFVKE